MPPQRERAALYNNQWCCVNHGKITNSFISPKQFIMSFLKSFLLLELAKTKNMYCRGRYLRSFNFFASANKQCLFSEKRHLFHKKHGLFLKKPYLFQAKYHLLFLILFSRVRTWIVGNHTYYPTLVTPTTPTGFLLRGHEGRKGRIKL